MYDVILFGDMPALATYGRGFTCRKIESSNYQQIEERYVTTLLHFLKTGEC